METLEQFVKRLSESLDCYSHANKKVYSLKKYNSDIKGKMGVFGWASEKVRHDRFVVSTYEYLADSNGKAEADEVKCGAHFVSRNKDQGQGTGLYYHVTRGSSGRDFQKAVRALKVIRDNR
jgi:hypothetical protein